MNKLILKTIAGIVLVLALFAGTAMAGDFASLGFVGFSKDGRYLAFEEYGTQDGSGYPYSNYYFIDTSKNAYAAPPVLTQIKLETGAEDAARAKAATLALKKLKQFSIIKGNTGKLVLSHLMTDLTFDDITANQPVEGVRFASEIWSMHREGDYELMLKHIKIKTGDCAAYEEDTFMLELKLTNKDDDTSKLLQQDTAVPSSRGCPLSYRVQNVYLYNGLIAVFINVFTQGFEGPDMRFMAVTGKLK